MLSLLALAIKPITRVFTHLERCYSRQICVRAAGFLLVAVCVCVDQSPEDVLSDL